LPHSLAAYSLELAGRFSRPFYGSPFSVPSSSLWTSARAKTALLASWRSPSGSSRWVQDSSHVLPLALLQEPRLCSALVRLVVFATRSPVPFSRPPPCSPDLYWTRPMSPRPVLSTNWLPSFSIPMSTCVVSSFCSSALEPFGASPALPRRT